MSGRVRLLCISPHPDDVEFGLGGLLHRYREEIDVRLVVLSDRATTRGESDNRREQISAMAQLGVPEASVHFVDDLPIEVDRLPIRFMGSPKSRDRIRHVLSWCVTEWEPEVVFVPGVNETMQDHSAVAEEAIRILRGPYMLLGYEVPKHNRRFQPTMFVPVSDEDLVAKSEALEEFRQFTNRYYFNSELIRALALMRGADAGQLGTFEAFEVYRYFVRGGLDPFTRI